MLLHLTSSLIRIKKRGNPVFRAVFVYADVEARQEGGVHVASLICSERQDDDGKFESKEDDCVERSLAWLRELSVLEGDVEEERSVICVAHNFQGYNSYFLLDKFYKQKICPEKS